MRIYPRTNFSPEQLPTELPWRAMVAVYALRLALVLMVVMSAAAVALFVAAFARAPLSVASFLTGVTSGLLTARAATSPALWRNIWRLVTAPYHRLQGWAEWPRETRTV